MQAGPAGGSEEEDDEGGIFAEINITPLTDVFMVLLIIMMVVSSAVVEEEKEAAYEKAQIAERAMQIMTPDGAGDMEVIPEDIVVTVTPDRVVFVNDKEVPLGELDARFQSIAQKDPRTRIILRGDKSADYEVIMDIITRLNGAGLGNIALASRT
jgi:biopolymer transport protein ExbD